VAGDGNCLFRAIADQMEGNPEVHAKYRKRICEFIETNRYDYEPFIEDDEPCEEYMVRMKRNATWGGQMEIQACSLAYSINITIHQLGQPRWDIINFQISLVKTIHLSYHQGEHYSSVRKIGDESYKHVVPVEIKLQDSLKPVPKPVNLKEEKKKVTITPEEQMVMEVSGCMNREFVRQLLIENWGEVNATVEFILTVGPDNYDFHNEYLQEKRAEAKQPKKNNTTTTTTASTSTASTSTASTSTTITSTSSTSTTTIPASDALDEEDTEKK